MVRKFFTYLTAIIIVYLYIYNPIFSFTGGIGGIKILYILTGGAFIAYHSKFKEIFKLFTQEFYLFCILFVYTTIRTLIGGEPSFMYTHLVFLIEITIIPYTIIVLLNQFQINDDHSFVKLLLVVGVSGAAISTACAFYPSINTYVRDVILMQHEVDYGFWEYRGYGLAEGLTGFYGFTQGMLLALGMMHIKENMWFIFTIPFMIVSILFNARTGFIIFIASIIIYLLIRRDLKITLSLSIGILLVLLGYNYLTYSDLVSEQTLSWIESAFSDSIDAVQSKDISRSGTASVLFGSMLVWPDNFFDWIFGRGYSLFGLDQNGSDVGFILHLNYGGLLYITILLMLLVCLAKHMSHYEVPQYFLILFWCVYFIANTKGNYLSNSGTFRCIMLMYYFFIYNREKRTLIDVRTTNSTNCLINTIN